MSHDTCTLYTEHVKLLRSYADCRLYYLKGLFTSTSTFEVGFGRVKRQFLQNKDIDGTRSTKTHELNPLKLRAVTMQTTTKPLSKLMEICMQRAGKIKTVKPLEYRTSVQVSTVRLFYTVAHNCHGKTFFVTAKSFLSPQNHFGHGKIILAMAKSFPSWQNHFNHAKIIFVTAKPF